MTYADFLAQKSKASIRSDLQIGPLPKLLFDFQKDVVTRALVAGRYCVWADCGLGKTLMQLAWAQQIPGNVLIVAPLAVVEQTILEARKIKITVRFCEKGSDAIPGISITNYEMLHHFDSDSDFFAGLVLDESSILKSLDGKRRSHILTEWTKIPYRLACTATPSPNDHMEIGSHAEFVGASTYAEMLAQFFVHDGGETSKWRLKKHAEPLFWKWVCSWAVMFRKPSDLGYSDDGFVLPEIELVSHCVDSSWTKKGYVGLLPFQASSLSERLAARKGTIKERIAKCAELVNGSKESWVVWCNLNAEGNGAEKAIPDAVQVQGCESVEVKREKLLSFGLGKKRVMITKCRIAGFGLNWQHCRNVLFLGLSDSWEQYYQAIRRCWRFGQKHKVTVHVVLSQSEGPVLSNILRKESDADRMMTNMVKALQSHTMKNAKDAGIEIHKTAERRGSKWKMLLGDCVFWMSKFKDASVGYSIFSPPFASLYTYSASDRDMGNCRSDDEFQKHFRFAVDELFRVLASGRLVSFHCMNLPTSKSRQGFIGVRDFRGDMIRLFQEAGFIFHSEVCIWKDPVTAMQRTKAIGLLWKQLKKDSCLSRQGIPDYLVTMRKPGENAIRVGHRPEEFPVDLWQKWASPVWMDINPSDTLQYRSVREHKDERHICPLQLEVIRRGVLLWSNPNDIVLSPFAGIGSEGVISLECGRRFIGIELKGSYWKQSVANLGKAGSRIGRTMFPSQAR